VRETLQTFFERTAHSRDANGFLAQYHRVDQDRFLMLIPKIQDIESLNDFINEIQYLVKLELCPALTLCEEFLSGPFKSELIHQLCKGDRALSFYECKFSELVDHLLMVGKSRPFYKYMLVDKPLRNEKGELVNLLHLNMNLPKFDKSSVEALQWLKPFLEKLGPAFSMQLVHSGMVLEELFTKQGGGTLLSLGYQFSLEPLKNVEMKRLCELLEKGFLRKLTSSYMTKLKSGEMSALIERDYRGVIIIQHVEDMHYLDKVVVAPEYFGRGMGSLLLDELTENLEHYSIEHPKLIWRAKTDNPFLPRYATLVYDFAKRYPGGCGTLSDGLYVYHFIGLTMEEREKAYAFMRDYPSSFEA